MSRNARYVRFGLVFIGMLFFCNPYFAVIDILPDFIGCLLICVGLGRVSLIQSSMREARTAFLKLALVDLLKAVALLIVFGAGNPKEQPTALLLTGFSAAVVELMFLIPAMRNLFDGFSDLAITYDCVSLYANTQGKLSLTEQMQKITILFLIAREALCLLPEFAVLTQSADYTSFWSQLYDHIGVMRVLSCLLVGIAGICWMVVLSRFFMKLLKEKPALAKMSELYRTHFTDHPGIAIERRHAAAFIVLFAGSLFLIDFYLDFRNVIPDTVAGILLFVATLIPVVARRHRIFAAITAALYTVISTLSSKFSYQFAIDYSIGEITKNPAAGKAYLQMWMLALVEFLSFLLMLVAILLLLRAVILKWAGYRPEHNRSEFEDRCQSGLLSQLDGKLIRCFVLGFVSGLISFLYDYIKELPGKGILRLLDYVWIFDLCAGIVFAVTLASLLSNIYGEIKNRFLYD